MKKLRGIRWLAVVLAYGAQACAAYTPPTSAPDDPFEQTATVQSSTDPNGPSAERSQNVQQLTDALRAPARPPTHATMVVVITSRNGGELLAQTMAELRNLSALPEYQELLSRGDVSKEENDCAKDARGDRSGRVFDLAVCAQAWPMLDKAPLAKVFENAYQDAAGKQGLAVFPAVQVTWYEFQKRLRVDQLGTSDEVIDKSEEKPRLTQRIVEQLCKPNVTFVPRDRCQVQLKTRLEVFQPDIYASQVGYRIALNKDLPIDVATQLRGELLRRVTSKVKPAADEFRVVAFPKSMSKSEVRRSQGGNAPAQIAKFWLSRGMSTADLDLADGRAAAPMLLIFDQMDPDSAAPFQSWIQSLRDSRPAAPIGECPSGLAEDAHTKAVGSILFPEDVEVLLSGHGQMGVAVMPPSAVDGYFLSSRHFSGHLTVAGDKDWLSQDAFEGGDPRIVAVAPFSAPASSIGSVASALANGLSQDRSRILVVSAAERWDPPEKSSSIRDYGEALPSRTGDAFEDACKVGSWPSCLGRHPQVVVVASSTGAAGGSQLFAEDEYVLGASFVKLAAPGASIPVLAPCKGAPGSTPTWSLQAVDGTSFAAPLVSLVLSRLIQIGPERLSEAPELAVWRLLATTDPLATAPGGANPIGKVQFGELNARRALQGASEVEAGEDGAATLYERDRSGAPRVVQAVVAPFLWNDQDIAVKVKEGGVAAKGGIEGQPRGFITVAPLNADGTPMKPDVIPFRRIVRIAKRPNDVVAARPTFDIYYVYAPYDKPDLKTLKVLRRAWLGSIRNDDRGQTGFCRTDGEVQKGEVKSTLSAQSEPACLYAWRKGEQGFVALDMASVDDIVFPVLHSRATWISDIQPVELAQVTRSDSPWRRAFCEARPRREAWTYLENHKKAIDLEAACKGI